MSRTETEVRAILRRMMANGPLTALPAQPRDLVALLALAASRFQPKRGYSEPEVNDLLRKWLESFCDPFGVDHVTVRRSLVDARLLTRDKAGTAYQMDTHELSEALDDDARRLEPGVVMAEVRAERQARKLSRPQ